MTVLGEHVAGKEHVRTKNFTRIDAPAQRQRIDGSEPTSHTLVKPHRVSISRICAVSEAAGAAAAFFHGASVKWTWLFQKPATTVLPVQSITRASGGIWISLARPTAAMTPADVTMMASEIGVASGEV
jgi:hypothetical protein